MAERRMFAKQIIDSDAFLDMPLSTQALYFHLSMRADDDGFLNNAKKIQRTINSTDDDFKILIAKNFIINFETGICVVKHWRIHNYIQKDRYKTTVYLDEKEKLTIKNNNVYTLDTACIQDDNNLDAQVRLGKVSLGEENISRINALDNGFDEFWNAYPTKVGKDKALASWNKKKPNIDEVLKALSWQKVSEKWRNGYVPNPTTYLNEGRWKDEPIAERPAF